MNSPFSQVAHSFGSQSLSSGRVRATPLVCAKLSRRSRVDHCCRSMKLRSSRLMSRGHRRRSKGVCCDSTHGMGSIPHSGSRRPAQSVGPVPPGRSAPCPGLLKQVQSFRCVDRVSASLNQTKRVGSPGGHQDDEMHVVLLEKGGIAAARTARSPPGQLCTSEERSVGAQDRACSKIDRGDVAPLQRPRAPSPPSRSAIRSPASAASRDPAAQPALAARPTRHRPCAAPARRRWSRRLRDGRRAVLPTR
jgi:hypothetical protein